MGIYDIITLLEVGLMKYDGKRQRLNAIFKQIEKDIHDGIFHKVVILHDKDELLRVFVQRTDMSPIHWYSVHSTGNLNFKASKLTLKETKIEDYNDFKMIYHGKPYTFIYDDKDLQQIYDKHLQDYKDYLAK